MILHFNNLDSSLISKYIKNGNKIENTSTKSIEQIYTYNTIDKIIQIKKVDRERNKNYKLNYKEDKQ